MPASVAGILPLAALIDFKAPEEVLHFYQLSGRGMMWNWVITPANARVLLSHDGVRACCLDQSGAVLPLNCTDGRWGDAYHCSSPTTIRACMGVAALMKIEPPPFKGAGDRLQRVQIFLVSRAESKEGKKAGWYWAIVSLSGLVVFLAVLVTTVLAELYIAASYLIVVLLTGVVIHVSYGHRARRISEQPWSEHRRLVVVTENSKADELAVFIGPSSLVSPLLNRPLNQMNSPTHLGLLRWLLRIPVVQWGLRIIAYGYQDWDTLLPGLLRILVALQWGLTIIACGYQDWDAFVVFAWIALSILTSTFLYGEHASARSWLQSNGLRLDRMEVELSCRRAALSLVVALNPDRSTRWIDQFLAPSRDRTYWEEALQGCLDRGQWEEKIQACFVPGLLCHPRC